MAKSPEELGTPNESDMAAVAKMEKLFDERLVQAEYANGVVSIQFTSQEWNDFTQRRSQVRKAALEAIYRKAGWKQFLHYTSREEEPVHSFTLKTYCDYDGDR